MKRETAIAYGYVIADQQGLIQLYTLRSNRSACWKAFTTKPSAFWKKQGFVCVPVWVKEHERNAARKAGEKA